MQAAPDFNSTVGHVDSGSSSHPAKRPRLVRFQLPSDDDWDKFADQPRKEGEFAAFLKRG